MALIDVNPDLKRTNELLERIARVGEIIVLRQWGIRMGHCAERLDDPNPRVKSETTYTTDESALRQELIDVSQGRQPANIIDDED